MSQKNNDENKYFNIINQTNKDTPIIVSLLLFIKAYAFENEIFYIFSIFFRFMGLLIICGNFNNSTSLQDESLNFSYIIRIISSYGITKNLKMSNIVYNVISIILFILLLIIISFYSKIIFEIKNKNKSKNISIFKIEIIIENLCFFLFPYIIEFLSFIFYIQFIGDKYIIKKSLNIFFNLIILVLNSISIIGYNIQSFFHILSINNPLSENNNTIKLNYGRNKIIIICLLQNLIMFESLSLYLSDNYLKIYKTTLNILILIIFIIFYLYSHYSFNYNTKTNYLINILSIFCFFSIFYDLLLYYIGYKTDSYIALFFYIITKIIISFCFHYVSTIFYEKKMIDLLKEELFKIYNDKNISENKNFNCLHYFNELYKKIKEKNGKQNIKIIIKIILLHQSKCHNLECKCKYIQIFPYGKQYINEYINNFLDRINFLLESIFVELDYQKYYELTLLIAEHYYNYKNNPILAYSMIQTILFFNIKSLNTNQILILFTALNKYIAKCNDKFDYMLKCKNSEELEKEILNNKNAIIYKSIFNNYKYLMKIKKIIKNYATDYLTLLKYKENMEETIQLIKDENNDIIKITSYFLTSRNLTNIMNILLREFTLNTNLIRYIKKLDPNKIPVGLIYKCILFSEIFLCGKVPNEVISLMYSINSENNLYQQNLLLLIEEIYKKNYLKENSYYYLIFKFSNGINIHFFDEILSKKLGYFQKELSNSSIDKIFPKELRIPHNCSIIRHIMNEKNKTINNKFIFLFDREMQMYPALFFGICIPGLGKYLFCIIKLCFKNDKNEYYFYLGKNFECISLSYNFYKNYNISLNLLNKYKINLLDLFDIKFEDLSELNKDIIKINKYKENLDMVTDYFYSQKLFKEKSKNYSGENNFHLVSIMKKNENYYNEENNELNNNNINGQQINFFEKISNIKYQHIYLKNHLIKIKVKKNRKIFFDRIEELMNRYNNENNQTIKKLIFLLEYLNNIYSNKTTERIDFGYFYIEFGLKMIYNTYFYFFKIKEIIKDIPLMNQNINNLDYAKNDLISADSISSNNIKFNKAKTNGRISIREINNKNSEIKKDKKVNDIIIHKVKCYHYVIPLAILVLGILLIIYIIILLYQRNMVSSSYNGFLIYFYNFYQRNKLYALYSVLLSSYFHYLNMTNFTDIMNETDYIDLLERYSIEFQNSFHKFYDVYISNNNQEIQKNNSLLKDFEIYKIYNYYNQSIIFDNYLKEAEYIGYISRHISIEDNLTNIINDSKLLFVGQIFKTINGANTPTKSYYIQALYYLSRNYQSLFNYIYTSLEEETTSEFNELAKNSKLIYLLIEILGFIIILLFYIIILIFLHQTNFAIFRNIVNMFINNNEKENFHYKNKKDNYFLIKIISSFIVLISDFNLNNINNFNFIISQSASQAVSMDSTIDIRDDNSTNIDLIDYEKNKNHEKNFNIYKNKNETINKILDNKTNNSESIKFNLSSSKISLNNNLGDTLNNLNNPQNLIESNTNISNNITGNSNKSINFTNTISNKKLIKTNKNKIKAKKTMAKAKNLITNKNNKSNNLKIDYSMNDEEKMTAEIFLKKLVNNGIKEIKISLIILFILFIFVIVYVSVKIVISLNFITEIKEIFEDFGVLSYRFSSMYYYFNSLRTLLVFPHFGNDNILEMMQENMADKLKKMDIIIDFKLNKYPTVKNYYWITGTDTKNPKPSPSYINETCIDDQKCREVINNKKYDIFSEGLKMAITSMYQQIINIHEDYKKNKTNIKENNVTSYIKKKFINIQYEQIDINLNYVIICVENRIYEAFLVDLTSLANKYNSIIEALNICSVIYCFIVEFIVMIFIIFNLRRKTKKVEDATLRINNAFRYMMKKNINNDKEDNSSFAINGN